MSLDPQLRYWLLPTAPPSHYYAILPYLHMVLGSLEVLEHEG